MLGNDFGSAVEISANKQATASSTQFITVAHALMAGVVALAALLRFGDLGALPLNSAESLQALAPYQFSIGTLANNPIGSPAYFNLSIILQSFIGNNDAAALSLIHI